MPGSKLDFLGRIDRLPGVPLIGTSYMRGKQAFRPTPFDPYLSETQPGFVGITRPLPHIDPSVQGSNLTVPASVAAPPNAPPVVPRPLHLSIGIQKLPHQRELHLPKTVLEFRGSAINYVMTFGYWQSVGAPPSSSMQV